jgi:Tfp pilus assembly protein PilX
MEERGRVKTGVREAEAVLFAGGAGPAGGAGGARPAGRQKAGVSLIISVVLIGVLMFFAMAISVSVIDGIKQSGSVNRANVAYFATEGALEKGLEMNFESGAGQNTAAQTILFNGDPECSAESDCSICCQKKYGTNNAALNYVCIKGCPGTGQSGTTAKPQTMATFKIQGSVPKDKKLVDGYIIPAPGTGNVGAVCDPLNIPLTGQFYYSPTNSIHYKYETISPGSEYTGPYSIIDHPCNWSKIKMGETVAIPLYYSNGTEIMPIISPTNSTATFALKIRTPCKNGGEICYNPVSDRIVLDTTSGDLKNYGKNDPVVSWQIAATDMSNITKQYVLSPIVSVNPNTKLLLYPQSSIISENYIYVRSQATNNKYVVLSQLGSGGNDLNGCKSTIFDFLTNHFSPPPGFTDANCTKSELFWTSQLIFKPVFKFTVIGNLKNYDTPHDNVSNLEYQILMTNVSNPPTNSVQTITGESVSGSYKQVLEVKMPQESGILEYVIQQ